MYCHPTTNIFLLITAAFMKARGQNPVAEKVERLQHWIAANRDSLPQPVTDDLVSSVSESSDLAATILKIFGFGPEPKVHETQFTRTTDSPSSPKHGIKVAERDVCAFGADPLILSGEYHYCKPTIAGECPAGFVCDFSMVLGRSICCQDMRNQPVINIKVKPIANSTLQSHLTTFSSRRGSVTAQPHTRWSSTMTNRRAPWYIKERTSWSGTEHSPVPTRITIKPTNAKSTKRTTATAESTFEVPTVEYNTSTAKTVITLTTKKRAAPSKSSSSSSEFRTISIESPQTPSSAITPAIDDAVSVSLIQAGNIRKLTDNQMLIVGAITLVNDHGYRVLVDTGSTTDTELLLQGLSKEMIPMDNIANVVITSGHPTHIGNINLFPQKPILFHTMEYVGQHATVTELKDRPYRKLTENIEVWKTPGRTQQSLSVLVHNVDQYGTMAIVGDLIPAEDYIFNKTDSNVDIDETVWDSLIRRQNSNLIVCLADWIIPGHGQPFRVVPRYRQRAGCTRLLAQRKVFGKM